MFRAQYLANGCRYRFSYDGAPIANGMGIAIVVHAFVTSRIDYCISLLAGAPKTLTDKLQRVMNAAARIISNIRKFDHGLMHLRRDVLHWLDVADRIMFRLCVYVFLCVHGKAPSYRSELCRSVSESEGRRHLQSTRRTLLQSGNRRQCIWLYRTKAWNSLPDYLRCSVLSLETFRRQLKKHVFIHTLLAHSAH